MQLPPVGNGRHSVNANKFPWLRLALHLHPHLPSARSFIHQHILREVFIHFILARSPCRQLLAMAAGSEVTLSVYTILYVLARGTP
ncbi:uncharacterized protein LMH87_007881 [Akanthomyces muscarius]|uniref:Uncharacterized protein n=1 Tax=Akanthomyces muscarius TaxID=2231603 RepID=A0A9W8UPT0_AKAMU|nr:uncharacterized protein LMH87_007881 [Akanthomyces muscarius]KAJ4159946.1 hypothetical protein LMH87_007881 [Akanthomyces muscarius]